MGLDSAPLSIFFLPTSTACRSIFSSVLPTIHRFRPLFLAFYQEDRHCELTCIKQKGLHIKLLIPIENARHVYNSESSHVGKCSTREFTTSYLACQRPRAALQRPGNKTKADPSHSEAWKARRIGALNCLKTTFSLKWQLTSDIFHPL